MDVEYDPAKTRIRERGLSFERVREFDFDTAILKSAIRNGEMRWIATGYLDGLLHTVCCTPRPGVMRVISFRRAEEGSVGSMNEIAGLSDEELEELKDTEDWTDDKGEVRELTRAHFARMKPFSSLPLELQSELLSLKGTAAPVADKQANPVACSDEV